jgi:hypothetical protein
MKEWPDFNSEGDLPVGIHQASLSEVVEHFGQSSWQRRQVAQRLIRIYNLAINTSRVVRFIVYGSFVPAKQNPNDVDIFLLMDDSFDPAIIEGESAVIFDHMAVHHQQGASVFWSTRRGAFGSEQALLEDWQYKRGHKVKRGIVEVISHD